MKKQNKDYKVKTIEPNDLAFDCEATDDKELKGKYPIYGIITADRRFLGGGCIDVVWLFDNGKYITEKNIPI